MKSILSCLSLVLSIFGTAHDAIARQDSTGGLVVNGGFELDADQDGMPDGWTLEAFPDDRFVKAFRSPSARSASCAFCLEKSAWRRGTNLSNTANGRVSPTLSSSSFDLQPRVTYEISLWVKMESPFPLDQMSVAIETNTSGFRGARSFPVKLTREWTKHTFTLLTEADTRSGTLVFSRMGNWSDRLFIDDVQVVESGVETDPALPLCWHPWLPAPKVIYNSDLDGFEFPSQHPRVEHTAEEIATIVQSMIGKDLSKHLWVRAADPWLEQPLFFFAEGAKNEPTARFCPSCRHGLEPFAESEETYGMVCPECDERCTTENHKSRARELLARDQAKGAITLGQAYALTRDKRYADRAAEILCGFASRYRQWGGGKRNTMYPLSEAGFLSNCATAYDYVYDALSEEDRRKIKDDLLRPGADYYRKKADSNGRMSNRGAIYNQAVMMIGAAIGDAGLVNHALNSPYSGFHVLLAGLFDPDGLTPEGFYGYQRYTMKGLCPMAETAYRLGINVYRDPAYRKVFEAPLDVLLPGEDEGVWEMLLDEYQIASRRFTEVGPPMAYPFGDDKRERATRLSSRNFQHRGYGILRTGEGEDHIYVSMTYGREAMWYGHCENRKFSLVFYANGRLWTPRGRAPTYGHKLGGWSETALANNTLAVDDMDNWIGLTESQLLAFETTPCVKVMRAADNHAYPGVTLDRTVFLADGYVVDLAGARAENGPHRFDLCYRHFGKLDCGLPFKEQKGPLGAGYGYEYLTDVRSTRTGQAWSADWRDTKDRTLRVSVLGEPETEVMACTSPVNAYLGDYADEKQTEHVDAIVMRRWGTGTVFGAVWEPYRKEPSIARISSLPVGGDCEEPDGARGIGVEVIREGHESADYFLASYAPGLKRYGDIELDGKIAAGRWRDEDSEPDYAQLVNGFLLRRGSHRIQATSPASVYAERLSADRLRIKTGEGGKGRLTIEGGVSAKTQVECDGERIDVVVEQRKSVSFDTLDGRTFEISGVPQWTRIMLTCEHDAPVEDTPASEVSDLDWALKPDADISVPRSSDGQLEGVNKIANAGFEINPWTGDDVADAASPWEHRNSYYSANLGRRLRSGITGHDYDRAEAHGGKYSVKITTRTRSGATLRGRIEQKVATCGANKTYTLSAWVKASRKPTQVRLCLYGWDPNWGRDFAEGVSPEFIIGKQWQRISWTRTFGPGITDVYAMVKREFQIMGGDVWIDDVQVEEGERATDFAADAWTKTAQSVVSPLSEMEHPDLENDGGHRMSAPR